MYSSHIADNGREISCIVVCWVWVLKERYDMKYTKKYLKKINNWFSLDSNHSFLSRHPEIERFDMPKTFFFRYLPEKGTLHWAIIVPKDKESDSSVYIYFINDWGRIFDRLEYKHAKIARRRLRRNGFDFSTNRYCPFTPPEPLYIQLSEGKKSAPYSKGNLWCSVQRNKKHIDRIENTCINQKVEYYEKQKSWIYKEKVGMPADVHKIMTENDIPTAYNILMSRNKTVENKPNANRKLNIKKSFNYAYIIYAILLLIVLILTLLGY